MRTHPLQWFALSMFLAASISRTASGVVYELGPQDDWYHVLSGTFLQPGDEVVLAGGVYSSASRLSVRCQGTAEAPILIRAAQGANVVMTRPDASQNVINIEGGQYLTLRGVEVTGGSFGVRINQNTAGNFARFVTIEECHIHDVGGPAVTCSSSGQTYEGMVFRRNEIDHTAGTGEGFYLGSNNAADGTTTSVFFNGLIEGNYIHDLNGPSVSQGDGIEIKDGSYGNIIRDNVIHDTNYPGILLYGTDGNPPNLVERNVVWNTGDNGIQAASEAIIRNNIIVDPAYFGIHSKNHQSAMPGSLTIVNNTIFSHSGLACIRVDKPTVDNGPIVIANNAMWGIGTGSQVDLRALGIIFTGNVVSQDPAADFVDVALMNFAPAPGSALLGAGDPAYVVADDFDGAPRLGVADAGAYAGSAAGQDRWQVQGGFKPLVVIPGLIGDANRDGVVDALDYIAMKLHWGLAGGASLADGDFNCDGIVDWHDLVLLISTFGTVTSQGPAPTSIANIPEPTMLSLLALSGLALIRRRRLVPITILSQDTGS